MIIERLEVENFRSLKNINVGCDELTVLLGRNGAGKSSILYALDFFYNVSAQANPFDYFDQDTQEEIKIRVTFGALRIDETEEFKSQLTDGKLIVTKIVNSGGSKYYGASKQVPEFQKIRQLAAREKIKAFNALVDGASSGDSIYNFGIYGCFVRVGHG